MSLFQTLRNALGGSATPPPSAPAQTSAPPAPHLPREDADFPDIWRRCEPYTMTSFERGLALYRAIRYLVENRIEGDIMECGVWRGGSSMVAMLALLHFGAATRRILMLDTYEGMTQPSARDIDLNGISARQQMEAECEKTGSWGCASLDEVKQNVASTGYPAELIEFVKGDVRTAARTLAPRDIALLRLDTDFYDSTMVELETFYPRLREKGILIIDDYGHWAGAREATEEYFAKLRREGLVSPLLTVIDYTGRLAVK